MPSLCSVGATLPQPNRKPVLLSADLDDTMVAWEKKDPWVARGDLSCDTQKLARNAQALQSHRSQLAVNINTGRGLSSLQQVAPHLKPIPVDYLSLNNGQELYINWHQVPTDEWIAKLKPTDASRVWKAFLHQATGWDATTVLAILNQTLQEEGFLPLARPFKEGAAFNNFQSVEKRLANNSQLIVNSYDNQPTFAIHGLTDGDTVFEAAHEQAALALRDKILEKLKALGIQGSASLDTPYPGALFKILVFSPQQINKASILEYLIQQSMPDLQGVITAGDSPNNDLELLSTPAFGNPPVIPNYPIVSGDHPGLVNPFAKHPTVARVPRGDLALGIQTQMQRILPPVFGQHLNQVA